MQGAEGIGGEAEHGLEDAREMEGVGKAGFFGHLLDQHAGLLQARGGMVHFQAKQILIGGLLIVAPEEPAEIGVVGVAFGGDLGQGVKAEKMLLNVFAALLVGGKGQGFHLFQRGLGGGDFQGEAFQEAGTEFGLAAAGLQAAGDEFIEQRHEGVGGNTRATWPGASRQERKSVSAPVPAKFTKYLMGGAAAAPVM